MGNLLALVRLEGRLLIRGPMVWLTALAAGGLAWLVFRMAVTERNLLHIAQQFSFIYTGPLSIGAVIAGVYGAKRDKVLKTGRLLEALPYRSGSLHMVRFGWTAAMFIVLDLVPAGILVWQWATMLDGSAEIGRLLSAEVFLALGMVFPVALGWLVGTVLPGRSGYLAGFLGWLLFFYGALFLSAYLASPAWYALPNVALLDLESMGFLDKSWGILADSTFWLHRIFGLALAAAMLTACVQSAGVKRKESMGHIRRIRVAGLIALALLIASGAWYTGIRERRAAGYERWEAQTKAQVQAAAASAQHGWPDSLPYTVGEYRLRLVQPEQGGRVSVHAELELTAKNPMGLQELVFTLSPDWKVASATLDHAPVRVEHNGYSLVLRLSGTASDWRGGLLELEYAGKPESWRILQPYGNSGQMVVPSYRTAERQWYLPGTAAWYPIPGMHALVQQRQQGSPIAMAGEWSDHYPALPEARFEVTVEHHTGAAMLGTGRVQQHFAQGRGESVTFVGTGDGFTLVGGPFREVTIDGNESVLAWVGDMQETQAVEDFLALITPWLKTMDGIFGVQRDNPLILLPVESAYSRGGERLGGLMTVDIYQLRQTVQENRQGKLDRFIKDYANVWLTGSGSGPGIREELFIRSVQAYARLVENAGGQELGLGSQPDAKRIESYMNSHSREEIGRMLQKMYAAMKAQHDRPLPLDDILR